MKYLFALLCISVLMFVSCLSEKEYPVKITEENGIKTISNPDYPKEGVYDLVLEELFTLGKEEDNSKYLFGETQSMRTDDKFNLYVQDANSYKFFVFDKEGNYIRQFGSKGQGPGDFGALIFFAISHDNKIVFTDVYNKRICRLDLNGKYLSGLFYKKPYLTLMLDSKDNLYCIEAAGNTEKVSDQLKFIEQTHEIHRLNTSNNEWETIGSFTGEKYLMKNVANGGISIDGPYNQFIWIISPDDKLYTCFADTYEFCVNNLDGKIVKKFNRKFSPFVNPDYKQDKNNTRYLPALSKYNLFDNEGNFWCGLDNGEKPEYFIYDIFNKDGVYLKQVHSKYRIELLKGDRLYSFVRSETDPVYVKAFKYSLKKREK